MGRLVKGGACLQTCDFFFVHAWIAVWRHVVARTKLSQTHRELETIRVESWERLSYILLDHLVNCSSSEVKVEEKLRD